MKQITKILATTVVIWIIMACGPLLKKSYLDYQHAEEFLPCPSDKIENPRAHAFIGMQTSLAATDWVIQKVDSDKLEVIGRKCTDYNRINSRSIDYLKRPDHECSSVLFMVKNDAKIYAIVPDKKKLHKNMLYKTFKWIGELDRHYSEFRCYSEKELLNWTPESRER